MMINFLIRGVVKVNFKCSFSFWSSPSTFCSSGFFMNVSSKNQSVFGFSDMILLLQTSDRTCDIKKSQSGRAPLMKEAPCVKYTLGILNFLLLNELKIDFYILGDF